MATLAPVAIAAAPNGGRRTKANHAALPVTAAELVRTAEECCAAGAAMLHLHVRDSQGRHQLDAENYLGVMRSVRKSVGDRLLIQITSESVAMYGPAAQMAVVKAVRPEAVSIAVRELVPDASHEQAFAEFLDWMRREHVVPQVILYSPDEAVRWASLGERGLIPWNSLPVLFVLGSYTSGQPATPTDLLPFIAPGRPKFAHWMVCAFGANEAACVTTAAFLGGDVRVGFENNFHRPDGTIAPDNAAQVQTVAEILRSSGVPLLDAAGLRAAWAAL
ncbi:MAG: 3-keto-5-aminohexanoate cleavage protein [Opitutus sp.]|nr:3-keto-5-aminohexanoate cleavage protein [Opitutus sp.]